MKSISGPSIGYLDTRYINDENDVIKDSHIDWGTGANQVSAVDVPIADAGAYYSGTEVETALQEIGDKWDAMNEPTGFPNRTDSTVTWSDSTPDRTMTIAPSNGSFSFYQDGLKYTKTSSETIQITDVEGLHYIYYDAGTLTVAANPTFGEKFTIFAVKVPITIVSWDATNNEGIYVGEERHGITMDGDTHTYNHFTRGLQYVTGLALNTIDADQGGSSNAHAQFGVDSGSVSDEDIGVSPSAITSTTGLPVYYRDGANGDWRKDTNAGYSILTIGSGRMAWNELTGGSWQQTEVADNKFALAHVFVTTEKDNPLIAIMGQNTYSSQVAAREGATVEIGNLLLGNLPSPEIRPIASVIFQTKTSYTNDVNARIRTTDEGDDYVDFRTSEITRSGGTGDHGSLAGLTDPSDHLWALLVDGTRDLSAQWSVTQNIRIDDDSKLLLGTGEDGEIYSTSDDLIIANVTQDKDIIFQINVGGVTTEIMRFDGSTGRVGIRTPVPTAVLDISPTGLGAADLGLKSNPEWTTENVTFHAGATYGTTWNKAEVQPEMRSLYVQSPLNDDISGSITIAKGLHIDDITGGDTNYAIDSEGGLVRLAGDLQLNARGIITGQSGESGVLLTVGGETTGNLLNITATGKPASGIWQVVRGAPMLEMQGNLSQVYGLNFNLQFAETAGYTATQAYGNFSSLTLRDDFAGEVTNYYAFQADGITDLTTSHAFTVTNFMGFRVRAVTLATNTYGFVGEIASAANRWNLYMSGTANNYLAGSLGIGEASPNYKLVVGGEASPEIQILSNTNTGTNSLYFGDSDAAAPGRIQYDHSTNDMSFWTGGSEKVTILTSGNVGIGTTAPGQIFDVNSGSGNMIADGYDTHSLAIYKENITRQDGIGYIDKLKAFGLYQFTKIPFVSTEELVGLAEIEFKMEIENAREYLEGLAVDDPIKVWIDTKREELQGERCLLPKYQRKHLGLVADDKDTVTAIPDVISRNEDDSVSGYSLGNYVGFLHGVILELVDRVEKLEA